MPPKRKKDDDAEPSARQRKKLKMADARTIAVEAATPASINMERFTEVQLFYSLNASGDNDHPRRAHTRSVLCKRQSRQLGMSP